MRNLPVNKTGYLKGAKTAKNPVNVIPSNLITTQGMAFPIKANGKTLYPNTGQYKFNTPYVVETPLKQDGSEELRASQAAKFTYRIKDKKRRDTQVADMYNNTLDSFRGDTIGAKRHFKSFFTHYGSERFDGVRPLEGYYGFDRKDYNDKTLDSLGKNWHKQMKTSKKQKGTKSTKAESKPSWFNTPMEFGKEPGSIGRYVGKALTLGAEPPKGKGYSFTPSETAKQTAIDYITGEIGGAAINKAMPYIKSAVKPIANYADDLYKKVIGNRDYSNIKKPWTITKENIKHLVNEYKRPMKPVKFDKTKGNLIHKDPYTGEVIYEIDPADYDNFSTPELKQQALRDLEKGKKDWYDYINKKQEEVVEEAQRLITPKVPLVKKTDFHTNSEVRKMSRNHKDFQKLEKEINELNPNIENEEDLNKLFLSRPDLEKRWYGLAEEGKNFNKKMLSPSQQKYLDKERGYVSTSSKPQFMSPATNVSEKLHPSPQDLKKVKFPIRFPLESLNKDGNKNVKSNLIKYQQGTLSVSAKNKKQFQDVAKIKDNELSLSFLDYPQKQVLRVIGGNGKENYSDIIDRKKNTPGNYIYSINKKNPYLINTISSIGNVVTDPLNFVGGRVAKGAHGVYNTVKTFAKNPRLMQKAKIWRDLAYGLTAGNAGRDISAAAEGFKKGSKSVSLAFSRGEKDPKGGLTQKGVDKYNRATGGNLKMAVTTPPSKLKPGSKAANRRKSFCARMSGVKGPMEKNGKPTRKALALRKWNC